MLPSPGHKKLRVSVPLICFGNFRFEDSRLTVAVTAGVGWPRRRTPTVRVCALRVVIVKKESIYGPADGDALQRLHHFLTPAR